MKRNPRAYRKMVEQVATRDGAWCRACGGPGCDPHHIIFRSRGGSDDASNLVLLCRACHGGVHAGRVEVTFDLADPAGTVQFLFPLEAISEADV